MKGFLATSVNTLLVILLTLAATAAAQEIAVPAQQHPGQTGLFKAAQMGKASTPLVRVFSEYRAHANQGLRAAFRPSDQFLPFSADRVLIDARAISNGAALLVFASIRYSRKAPRAATECASATNRTKTRLLLGQWQPRQGRTNLQEADLVRAATRTK